MSTTREELRRRVGQFTALLTAMNRRAHDIAQGPCFMIFDEHPPSDQTENDEPEAGEGELEALLDAFRELGLLPLPKGGLRLELPETGWRAGSSPKRFVQFSFERDNFQLDLPRQTLSRDEAEQILRQRADFFYLVDRPQHILHGEEDLEDNNPFRKVYVYGSEPVAAADVAFILFRVWKLPVDARLYVTAAAFGKDIEWEQGELVR